MLDASLIVKAYNEIITWLKNSFLVPHGKTGRDFIDQITKHINDCNNGTEMQHTALAAFVLLAVGLQNSSKKSESKDHQECLARRLVLWNEGEVDALLREGRMIQRHLDRSPKEDAPNKAKIFPKLVMEGQIHSGQYKIWTADCGLRTYGLRTRYKTRTGKYGLGIKHGLGIKRGLQAADWV